MESGGGNTKPLGEEEGEGDKPPTMMNELLGAMVVFEREEESRPIIKNPGIDGLPAEILTEIFKLAVTSSSTIKLRTYSKEMIPKNTWTRTATATHPYRLRHPAGPASRESMMIPTLQLVSRKWRVMLEAKDFRENEIYYRLNTFRFDKNQFSWFNYHINEFEFQTTGEIFTKVQNLEIVFSGGERNLTMIVNALRVWKSLKNVKVNVKLQFDHGRTTIHEVLDDNFRRLTSFHFYDILPPRVKDFESFGVILYKDGAEVSLEGLDEKDRVALERFSKFLKGLVMAPAGDDKSWLMQLRRSIYPQEV